MWLFRWSRKLPESSKRLTNLSSSRTHAKDQGSSQPQASRGQTGGVPNHLMLLLETSFTGQSKTDPAPLCCSPRPFTSRGKHTASRDDVKGVCELRGLVELIGPAPQWQTNPFARRAALFLLERSNQRNMRAAESEHLEGNRSIRENQHGELTKWDVLSINSLEIIQIVGAEDIKRPPDLLIKTFPCSGHMQGYCKKVPKRKWKLRFVTRAVKTANGTTRPLGLFHPNLVYKRQ